MGHPGLNTGVSTGRPPVTPSLCCAPAPVLSFARVRKGPLCGPVFQGPAMKDDASRLNELLEQARQGAPEALGRLLEAHRTALHRRAELQLHGRIVGRVDPSDLI